MRTMRQRETALSVKDFINGEIISQKNNETQ